MSYISATAEIMYAPFDLRLAMPGDTLQHAHPKQYCRLPIELWVESRHGAEAIHPGYDPGPGRLPFRLHCAGDTHAERGREVSAATDCPCRAGGEFSHAWSGSRTVHARVGAFQATAAYRFAHRPHLRSSLLAE